jgi:cobalt-zinc-cadmium efflux system outer membrane protein
MPLAGQIQTPLIETQVLRVTLDEALRRAEAENLNLRVAREEGAAARGRLTTAGVSFNPGFAATREQLSSDAGSYYETTLALSQTLEIGGQRGLRRGGGAALVEAAEARLSAERVRLAFAVREAYVRAAAAEEMSIALEGATAVFRSVERSGQVRFAEGDISSFEQQRLQVERARYENLAADSRLAVTRAGRDLALLIAPDSLRDGDFLLLPASALGGAAMPTGALELDDALSAAADRPDVRAAILEADAAEVRLDLQGRERIPDLTLTGGYKDQRDGFRGAVIGLSLPLPLLDRNGGHIDEATAELAAAAARRSLALNIAQADVRSAWETYRSLAARVELVQGELLAGAGTLLRTAQVAYAEGEMSLIELLDAADAYRTARETSIDLIARYLTAFYDLQRATGRSDMTDLTSPEDGA